MADEFLIDSDGDVTDLVLRDVDRPLPSQLRDDPRFVEPVRVEIDADLSAVRETVGQLRGELLERFGFVPREVDVAARDHGWALYVDGELVDSSRTIGRDARGDLFDALSNQLWRMLRLDDVAELITFARIASPVAIDRAMPHRVTIEQLHRVLVRLLRDGLPIKPLDRIVEVLAEAPSHRQDTASLVERVRLARRRSIVEPCRQRTGALRVVGMSIGAIHACEHLVVEPLQPDDRRSRFLDRMRRDVAAVRTEHRLDPVVIVVPAAHRYAVATALRSLDASVLSDAEVLDLDAESVATLGEGIRVPPVPILAPQPPSEPAAFGSVWSNTSDSAPTRVDGVYLHDVVDVEVID